LNYFNLTKTIIKILQAALVITKLYRYLRVIVAARCHRQLNKWSSSALLEKPPRNLCVLVTPSLSVLRSNNYVWGSMFFLVSFFVCILMLFLIWFNVVLHSLINVWEWLILSTLYLSKGYIVVITKFNILWVLQMIVNL